MSTSPIQTGPAPEKQRHPCVPCQKRKVKCDRHDPCLNCVKAGKPCISPSTLPPRTRKKRFAEAELLARLRRYEEHLIRYGADIDAINNVTSAPTKDLPRIEPSEQLNEAVKSLAIRRSLKHVESKISQGGDDEFRDVEELLQGSSDEEDFKCLFQKTFDTIDGDGTAFLFSAPTSVNILELHPPTVQILRLWQLYLDNVNPMIKLFHAPSIQQRILEASADLSLISKGTEALLFGIYAMALTSIDDTECMNTFGEKKMVLVAQYQAGSRQALMRAGLLRSSDLMLLHAYVLYLLSCFNITVDPRSLFCLMGIAVRIAQRMGLNYDGTNYGLKPFDIEMRRRLWWQIVLLDFRISEISGAGSSIINHVWTTKLPLNINDSDLYPDMKDTPAEYPGATEMIYVLHRCEINLLLHNLRGSDLSLSEKDEAIDDLKKRLEGKYERYADSSVPLHLITILMARCNICKLHMGPRHPHLFSKTPIQDDVLFEMAIDMVESHNATLGSPSLKRFLWHLSTQKPMPAYLYLLCALRTRHDEIADRGWIVLEEAFRLRNQMKEEHVTEFSKHNTIELAVANLCLKAWNSGKMNRQMPEFVRAMKQMLAQRKGSSDVSDVSDPVTPQGVDFMDQAMGDVTTFGWDDWAQFQMPTDPLPMFDGNQMYYN